MKGITLTLFLFSSMSIQSKFFTNFSKKLPEREKIFFVNLQRDLLSNMRRFDRDNYLNPGFEWKGIARL